MKYSLKNHWIWWLLRFLLDCKFGPKLSRGYLEWLYLWLRIPRHLIMGVWKALKSPSNIYFRKKWNLELDLGCLYPGLSPLPSYLQHTSSWTWGKVLFLLLSQACCRSPHCIHCHRRTRGQAVSLPMFPCHKGAAFLQTQRVGSQDELVGVDCSSCYHAKISTNAIRGWRETYRGESI